MNNIISFINTTIPHMKFSIISLLKSKCLLMALLITGLFTAGELNAQTASPNGLYNNPQGTFVNVPTAIIRIDAELTSIKTLMSTMNPGSPSYREHQGLYDYYDSILKHLNDAKTTDSAATAGAIAKGLIIFTTDVYDYFDTKVKAEFKQNAINLLKL